LETAIRRRNLVLGEWVLAHGANPNAAPARDKRFPKRSLYELARLEQFDAMADLLARYGAVPSVPALNDEERYLDACFRLDRDQAGRMLAAHPEYRHSPLALFEAAKRDRADVLALLVELGTSVDLSDSSGKRALHEAAAHNALGAATFLIEHGADVDARESTYDATPIGWASHGDKTNVLDFLSRHSRDIWTLCFRGCVDRVRDILAADPALATLRGKEGYTPLWWLPDDEAKATQIVELLLAAGADASAKNNQGRTAAEWAQRRGMHDIARLLERAAGARH
jgi:ankyrin repeat protein